MIFPKLYKYTSKKQIQEWSIHVVNDSYITSEGISGGKITTSFPTTCVGKNIGKSNETTPNEQAVLEAGAKWQKKINEGYNEVLTDEKKYFEPMLAYEYHDYADLLFTVPTYVQPKLDGMRSALYDDRKMYSRKGKPIISCPHLEGYPTTMLDGELYNHELKSDFNKIMSLVRRTKPTLEELEESKKLIQYWVYDYPAMSQHSFKERYQMLERIIQEDDYQGKYKLVPTYQIYNLEELDMYHKKFIQDGYEGSMIRLDLGPYENKRSKQLLKYKDFQDAEFEIVDITPGVGNRSNAAGRLICKIGDKVFGCSMTGTVEFMEKVLREKNLIVGKQATVKFFQYTPDGIPRFPTLKYIHEYDSK